MGHAVELPEHVCRKSLHCLEHIHLEEQGLTGVAGESQKQNILYVLWSICFSLYQNTRLLSSLYQNTRLLSQFWACSVRYNSCSFLSLRQNNWLGLDNLSTI